MHNIILGILRTINQLLTAGIAITAFSLLMYALTFNLRDRVARSFALILTCVMVVFVAEALGSVADSPSQLEFWLRMRWLGIVFLPATYLQFSDALLATTGRPSRGRRRNAVRLSYLVSLAFLFTLPSSLLIGPLVQNIEPAPHLQRTWLTWVFTAWYAVVMVLSWLNLWRAHQRTVTSASRRRMTYLLAGALAPALGSYPYLLFGSGLAAAYPTLFWLTVTVGNLMVSILLVLMAYAVAFFGVAWPDRVVKRRLFKWLMRGPVTAIIVLTITTTVRRVGEIFGQTYTALVPVLMVGTILIMEHLITLVAPVWERWLFHGGDRADYELLQTLEERILTLGDIRQFMEAILAAICDRLQAPKAFMAVLSAQGVEMLVTIGGENLPEKEDLSANLLQIVVQNHIEEGLFSWGEYWLVPIFDQEADAAELLGLLGIARHGDLPLDVDQSEALSILVERAALALRDRHRQQQVVSSLEALTPQMDLIQQLRAAARYDGSEVLSSTSETLEDRKFSLWVKEALTHYWGGPKLTQSPLMKLQVVQQAMQENEENPTNALRAILRRAIEQVRPEGERRFTAEWILYNILEMKFMEGHKVREIAMRLAMSEADLYRKQRVAIGAVAKSIVEMEQEATGVERPGLLQPADSSPAVEAITQSLDTLIKQGGLNGK
jgi:hypothetical protein